MSEHNTNIVVVAVIYNEEKKVFIARRSTTKETWPNRFELTGGHLEPGETLEEGLHREVREEIGCDIEIERLFDAFTYESEGVFKVELSYLCKLKPGQQPKLNPNDHSEFLWINSSEIAKFEKEDDETGALRKAFKILEGGK